MSWIGQLRRHLKLTPTHHLLREIDRRGIQLETISALEVFGGDGSFHTQIYFPLIASLEVWEVNPDLEHALRRNLPGAKIKITDSFQEVQRSIQKWDMVMVDNPMATFMTYCEHFDLFPTICRLLSESALLVVNVIPFLNTSDRVRYPYVFNPTHLARRRVFYQNDHPENITIQEMIPIYQRLLQSQGQSLEWAFSVKRTFVYYLAMKTHS
jgi:hypothetical protein